MKLLTRTARFYAEDGTRIGGVVLLLVIGILTNLLKPWPLALLVDYPLAGHPLPGRWREWADGLSPAGIIAALVVLTVVLHIGQGILAAVANYLAIRIGLGGLRRARQQMFARLERLSLRFHHAAPAGDLIQRAAWDTYALQTIFQQGFMTLLTSALSLALMVIVMWRLNAKLTGVALVTVPLLLIVIRGLGRGMQRRSAAAQDADGRVTSQVQQLIASLPLVQSYTQEDAELERYGVRADEARELRAAQHGSELLYWFGLTVVFGLGTGALLWIGCRAVVDGELSIGTLLIFLAYLAQFYDPLNQLSHVSVTLASSGAGMKRVFDVLDSDEEVKESPAARPAQARGRVGASAATTPFIELAGVQFAYQAGRPVLQDVSFGIEERACVAIVGASGAGKSTLLSLLPRFFDPDAGKILLAGTDLRELQLHSLRSQIAVVWQEPILLPGTIAENIAYGRAGATLAEIRAAAESAQAHGFIERLEAGYDTRVGDGAARLSVGEKQRINLARAFLKDAPILLLDEPTSALDRESEAAVLESLAQLMRDRTTLVVAHRPETIRQASQVVVLDQGRVTECGSPSALLARGGFYARLLSAQRV